MHNISVYITKDDGSFNETPHLKLPQGFVLFTEKPKQLKLNRMVAKCSTDYFGGAGQQFAKVWDDKRKIYDEIDYPAINGALLFLGVQCDDSDEFDALGLGMFRTNEEIDKLIYENI